MSESKDRKLPETAARAILRRAAELDARTAGDLSLSEIEAAAREAGISDQALAQAVAESGGEVTRFESHDRPHRTRARLILVAVLLAGAMSVAVSSLVRERSITVQVMGLE